jgi:hypothetical protein
VLPLGGAVPEDDPPAHVPLWQVMLDKVQSVHVPDVPQAVSDVPD